MTNTDTERLDRLERAVSQITAALHPGAVAGSLSPFAGARERARAARSIPDALEISDQQGASAPLEHRAEGVA